jgi:hypothetical protein
MMAMSQNVTNQNMMAMSQNVTNQNMMAMSQNVTNQNMMAMTQINNQNMKSLSANNLTPYIIKPKITSLIRVLQCLYGCFEDIGPIQNLKNMIKAYYEYKNNKYSFSFEILDIISRSVNPDNNFIKLAENLRNKINALTNNLFSKDEEVSPNIIFFIYLKL